MLAETDVREHNFALSTEFPGHALQVVVDPIQIQQVVLNLIRNAIEAMLDNAALGQPIIVSLSLDAGNGRSGSYYGCRPRQWNR